MRRARVREGRFVGPTYRKRSCRNGDACRSVGDHVVGVVACHRDVVGANVSGRSIRRRIEEVNVGIRQAVARRTRACALGAPSGGQRAACAIVNLAEVGRRAARRVGVRIPSEGNGLRADGITDARAADRQSVVGAVAAVCDAGDRHGISRRVCVDSRITFRSALI